MIAITVDVEPDSTSGEYQGVAALNRFLAGFDGPFTLFIMPEIFSNFPDLVNEWSKKHEIGLHIHPERLGYKEDYFNRYTEEEQREIIERGLDVVSKTFDVKKLKSFRIGRWAFSKNLPRILEELGFTHDSSVYPSGVSDNRPREIGSIIEISPTIWVPPGIRTIQKLRGITVDDSWKNGGTNYESSSLSFFGLSLPLHFTKRGGFVFTEGLLRSVDGKLIYLATEMLKKTKYVVFAFHNLDLLSPTLAERIKRYIKYSTNERKCIKFSDTKINY